MWPMGLLLCLISLTCTVLYIFSQNFTCKMKKQGLFSLFCDFHFITHLSHLCPYTIVQLHFQEDITFGKVSTIILEYLLQNFTDKHENHNNNKLPTIGICPDINFGTLFKKIITHFSDFVSKY